MRATNVPIRLRKRRVRNTRGVSTDRFQRPQTAAGAHSVTASELPPHPPDVRDEEVAEILATDFPIALRGYDRAAVDRYHQRVSRVIAELQAGRSPQSAVRYALEQVSEETRSILQQAHDTADAVTTKSRREASERMATAERESKQLLADAEADAEALRAAVEREVENLRAAADRRVREAEDEVASIWQERERLIEDAREIASRLAEVAEAAAQREPPAAIEATEGETAALPRQPVWDDDGPDERDDDDQAPPPMWSRAQDEDDEDGPPPPVWGRQVHDEDDDGPPAPSLRAVPPPPTDSAPEPSLADAPPPPGVPEEADDLGPVAFELQDDEAELGPMDEPAASAAIDEAAVPTGETAEFTPAFEDDADEDDTAERPR
jgi:cell division septum initiation protein DivIVA